MDDQHADPPPESPPAHGQAPHSIRLATAWLPPREGSSAWVRRFGRPSGIESGMRVVLVIDGPDVTAIALNGLPLALPSPGAGRWTHDVTASLTERNELSLTPSTRSAVPNASDIDPHGRADLPMRYGRVSLEILTPPGGGQ